MKEYINSDNADKQANESKTLGLRRDSKIISNNFLFRRALNNQIEGQYEEYSNLYKNMLSFEWNDERLQKIKANPSTFST